MRKDRWLVYLSHFAKELKAKRNFDFSILELRSRDSSVGTALGYGLDDRSSRVRFPAGAGNFSLHHRVQNGSGAHPASYPMGTRGSFLGAKAAGSRSWQLTSIWCRGQRMNWAMSPLPNTPSWRGAQLKHRDIFTFTFYPKVYLLRRTTWNLSRSSGWDSNSGAPKC
jgi:hypothetical protein